MKAHVKIVGLLVIMIFLLLPVMSLSADTQDIESLIETLRSGDSEEREQASEALVDCGKDAVPALIEALDDNDQSLVKSSVIILGEIGEDAVDAVVPLFVVVHHGEPGIHHDIIATLASIGEPAVPELIDVLKRLTTNDLECLACAAEALIEIGEPAVSYLVEAMDDDDPSVRNSVEKVLKEIRPELLDSEEE